jgi:hypothetical protein
VPDESRLLTRTGMNEQHLNRNVSREIDQTHPQVIDDCGEPWCADQWHDPGGASLETARPKTAMFVWPFRRVG